MLRQLEVGDFGNEDNMTIFRSFVEALGKSTDFNISFAEEFMPESLAGYKWLERITNSPYLAAPYQVLQRLRMLRARREAKSFKSIAPDEQIPEEFSLKSREIGQYMKPTHLTSDEIIEKIKAGVKMTPTGFPAVDSLLGGGMEHGGIFVVAARTGVGKTSFALNIAKNVAGTGKHVHFCSLEMSEERIYQRFLQCFWSAKADEVVQKIDDMAVPELAMNFTISNPHLDLSRVLATLNMHLDADLLVVDYYQLIQVNSKEGQVQKLEYISNMLKQFAFEHRKPMIVVAQLNREIVKDRRNREPELSDLRGCGALEQDAHVVSFLWDKNEKLYGESEEGGTSEEKKKKLGMQSDTSSPDLRLLIKKNRNGKQGYVQLDFHPETMTFTEYDFYSSSKFRP